ncbi:hypothetical protein [Pelagerythrobacter marinus]|uniref:hypothetical protein n=1 Tax=Pelagerythrobacter marinus TaxID=538382 RepID=UPI002036C190|nr:hypothetical protein [Pelagerythrobacter marinus]USA39718.1 hypothetical protein NCF86_00735 [Pelagerythrobacter marinus]WPZ06151.1 hypothetical protein T8T98_12085 [Pelagerythrobacter marinus]
MSFLEAFRPLDSSHFSPLLINQVPFASGIGAGMGNIDLMVNGEINLRKNT